MNEIQRLQQLAGILTENIDNDSHPLEFIQWIHDLEFDGQGWEPNPNLYPMEVSILDWLDPEEEMEKVAEEAMVLLINKTPIYVDTPFGKSEVTIKFKKYTPRVDEEWGGEPYLIFKTPPNFTPENLEKFFSGQGDELFKKDYLGITQKNIDINQDKLNQDLKNNNQLNEITRLKYLAGIITEIKVNNPNIIKMGYEEEDDDGETKIISLQKEGNIWWGHENYIEEPGFFKMEFVIGEEDNEMDRLTSLLNKYNIPYEIVDDYELKYVKIPKDRLELV